ncbi:1-(5-phosphoribosyl)-5-((5-phosphoribosylamino)methylideneamino) imidazole-4-carboxamide isomerase [Archaeoglobus sulfaticallidus PM70-1]|uniref:1-(5-phosphoribosyl)-5-[(5-phosphoribosylamino)methylideneamino] imidazole-4-carboxamide isomerase n=1 Tax=Archaeoglobus sulfaticallidus PM70-1 TaxID=387631 RepID=N0BJS5_9EURY|nr:1-(5-phosphoribosyl)-5-[(5-phosphoribosylamino)methylideneamino]imidazole-4-carboxamide isomerase [Archaeoglobus sulfaticallidus]AGK60751.1 1-(5-phosphoribosyl)-5-((5-phosphoribosylamino)methylideneamino) imidazole-4-carboxamide isomerase [Archaeoglobus sulfaticallidus PM70-1]
MPTRFLVIPAIDLKDGRVTRLVQGDFSRITVQIDNPLDVARNWIMQGAKCLHIIDLDGAFEGALRHEREIREILSAFDVEVQVGGGIRDPGVIESLLDADVDRVILGTLALTEPDAVKEIAASNPSRIMIAVDSKEDKVAIKGWTEKTSLSALDVIGMFEDVDVSFLYTNIDVEGLIKGIDRKKLTNVLKASEKSVYVAGGISSIEDIAFIRDSGAEGVIIGSALYTGKLNYREAVKLQVF